MAKRLTKAQHIVPRFYLERFAGIDPKGQVWTYDMQAGTCWSAAPKKSGFRNHTYSFTNERGERDDSAETTLAEYESKAAALFPQVTRGELLATQDRGDFASFLALMFSRSPYWRRAMTTFKIQGIETDGFIAASDPKRFLEYTRRYEEEVGPLTDEHREELRLSLLAPGDYKFEVLEEYSLAALNMSSKLAPIFFDMTWTVVHLNPPLFFVTGDSSVAFRLPPGGGLAHPLSEVSFPLGPQDTLVLSWRKGAKTIVETNDPRVVLGGNEIIAHHSERFVFADRRADQIQALCLRMRGSAPGFAIRGGPKKFSQVSIVRKHSPDDEPT